MKRGENCLTNRVEVKIQRSILKLSATLCLVLVCRSVKSRYEFNSYPYKTTCGMRLYQGVQQKYILSIIKQSDITISHAIVLSIHLWLYSLDYNYL